MNIRAKRCRIFWQFHKDGWARVRKRFEINELTKRRTNWFLILLFLWKNDSPDAVPSGHQKLPYPLQTLGLWALTMILRMHDTRRLRSAGEEERMTNSFLCKWRVPDMIFFVLFFSVPPPLLNRQRVRNPASYNELQNPNRQLHEY